MAKFIKTCENQKKSGKIGEKPVLQNGTWLVFCAMYGIMVESRFCKEGRCRHWAKPASFSEMAKRIERDLNGE